MHKATKETQMGELIREYPQAIPVLLKFGLHCIGCPMSALETIEQGALAHGLSEQDINKLVEEINQVIEKPVEKTESQE